MTRAGTTITVAGARTLVTGASGGLGHAIARALAAAGAQLVLTGRREEVLEALAGELYATALPCDLSSREELPRLLQAAGEIDVLIANAALPASGLLAELSQEEVDRMLEVNLRAPIALARSLVPGMIDRARGHMVFLSSLSGKAASGSSSIYSATKFGIRGFALGLREDLRPHGVGVSLVLPGFVRDAGMYADAGVALPIGVGTSSPEEVAQAVVRAIERNRAEIDVAPAPMRLSANFASLAPEVASLVSRRLGSQRIAAEFAERQRHKRT
jgi:short-subunit dehydrogenase